MRKIKINITGGIYSSETLFDVWLTKNLITFDGTWTCLPGHLPKTKGYFEQLSFLSPDDTGTLQLREFHYTMIEAFKEIITRKDDYPDLYADLLKFPDKPKTGMIGSSIIYKNGRSSAHSLGYGSTMYLAGWKVAEVY